METIESQKKELRSAIRHIKSAQGKCPSGAGELAAETLMNLPLWSQSGNVLLFSSLPDEISTRSLLGCRDKLIALPVVEGDCLLLRVYDPAFLAPGYRGIMEPTEDAALLDPENVDLAVVPGMAFDPHGRRLGRGGGYYDRLLPLLRCPIVGLCYDCQIVQNVPVMAYDKKVDAIVTEKKCYICR